MKLRPRSGAEIAGWLFADVLLVLAVIGIADSIRSPADAAVPSTTTTVATGTSNSNTTTPAFTSTTTMVPLPVLSLVPVVIEMRASRDQFRNGDLRSAVETVVSALIDKTGRVPRAGLVLAFGASPNADRNSVGIPNAKAALEALQNFAPDIFSTIAPRALWTTGQSGSVRLEIYIFID